MPDGATCWQCDAPADPACAYTEKLNIRSNRGADAEGFPVRRGRRMDTVRVSIPRCAKCQTRNLITTALIYIGFAAGAFAGSSWSKSGWGLPVGAFLVGLPLAFAIQWAERLMGHQLNKDYPPVARLRAAGWSDPG